MVAELGIITNFLSAILLFLSKNKKWQKGLELSLVPSPPINEMEVMEVASLENTGYELTQTTFISRYLHITNIVSWFNHEARTARIKKQTNKQTRVLHLIEPVLLKLSREEKKIVSLIMSFPKTARRLKGLN